MFINQNWNINLCMSIHGNAFTLLLADFSSWLKG